MKKLLLIFSILLALAIGLSACAGEPAAPDVPGSGDAEYEALTVQVEGLRELNGAIAEISVAELRELPQHELEASYKRTTGLYEEFLMSGCLVSDVIASLGGDINDYAGMGMIGRDNYYCLFPADIVAATPDLMLALVIDGEAKLDEDNYPARVAAQGQFGPYWVKQLAKIVLYEEIPEKDISSVWVFSALTEGIAPYEYEYYGSKDNAIDLEQVFSRLDYVDSRAFFTMKSSDGFQKNEAMSMVKSRYYIKIDGADAPTNVAPYIQLGMNVQHISWFSTNADAAVFPDELLTYMDTVEINGQTGLPINEVLYEAGVDVVREANFDLLGVNGEKLTVPGSLLDQAILVPLDNGYASVIWQPDSGYENIPSLMRIRRAAGDAELSESEGKEEAVDEDGEEPVVTVDPPADLALTVTGDGVDGIKYYTLSDLQALGESNGVFSLLNNWPTFKPAAARGVGLPALLQHAGVKDSARMFTVISQDGYRAVFTREQLLGDQYAYADREGNGAVKVVPMLCWAYAEDSSDPAAAPTIDGLRLLTGQTGPSWVNTAGGVQDTVRIEVSAASPGKWEAPILTYNNGLLSMEHEFMDMVKLYYTTDGSDPDLGSPVYNPSTSYFQPQLTQPLELAPGVTVKAMAAGYGRYDSQIATAVLE